MRSADEVGCHFDEFVVFDEVDGLLESECARGCEQDVLIAAGSADVGELFAAGDVDDEIVVAAVLADDHPFIHFIARTDKKSAALLQGIAGVSCDFASGVRDQHAARTAWDVSFPRGIALEDRRS